jgi:hypothetical protein
LHRLGLAMTLFVVLLLVASSSMGKLGINIR